jgi:hypothetical protein
LWALVEALPPNTVVPVPAGWLRDILGAGVAEPASGSSLVDLTCEDVGQLFDRSASTVRAWCAAGQFPGAYRLGREWRIPRGAIEAFQERQRQGLRCQAGAAPGSLGEWRRHLARPSEEGERGPP